MGPVIRRSGRNQAAANLPTGISAEIQLKAAYQTHQVIDKALIS